MFKFSWIRKTKYFSRHIQVPFFFFVLASSDSLLSDDNCGEIPKYKGPFSSSEASKIYQQYCQSGKQIRKLQDSFRSPIPQAPKGTPKDAAVLFRQQGIKYIRERAKSYFMNITHPFIEPTLGPLTGHYTIFIPPDLEDRLGISCRCHNPCAFKFPDDCNHNTTIKKGCTAIPAPSRALEQRVEIWQHYIEKFTTVKESASDETNKIDFQVSLNFEVFCKYGRANNELITGK